VNQVLSVILPIAEHDLIMLRTSITFSRIGTSLDGAWWSVVEQRDASKNGILMKRFDRCSISDPVSE